MMNQSEFEGTASYKAGLFGLATTLESARIVIIPVPWEVTTSYGGGTAQGPESVLKASPQIDLFDLELGRAYEQGYHLLPTPEFLMQLNDHLKPKALAIRAQLEEGKAPTSQIREALQEINLGCNKMAEWVYTEAAKILKRGQIPAVLGGDHSSPEGNIRAISEAHDGQVGVLHVDAHADLRYQYQGFERSHASIMNNVIRASWRPQKLVQVAIRDFSQEEYDLIQKTEAVQTFFDLNLKRALFEGESWASICARIIADLPEKVYVSFDIDGLSPEYCPHTGTPVPGGLTFDQANYLLRTLAESGRRIVGFDLNEVAPGGSESDEWDGNVGSRLLYKMCGWTIKSHN